MIEDYKRDIDKIHASEELMQKTIRIANEEKNKKGKNRSKIMKFSSAATVLAAAAAVVIIVNIRSIGPRENTMVRTMEPSGLFSTTEAYEETEEDESEEGIIAKIQSYIKNLQKYFKK
ncbi:hypothetical protein QYZ88_010425 [Lachnospiraceae bacterium C1.1]|nr:hypothetical protein [Lachnospiraceae bacterium C1.1]